MTSLVSSSSSSSTTSSKQQLIMTVQNNISIVHHHSRRECDDDDYEEDNNFVNRINEIRDPILKEVVLRSSSNNNSSTIISLSSRNSSRSEYDNNDDDQALTSISTSNEFEDEIQNSSEKIMDNLDMFMTELRSSSSSSSSSDRLSFGHNNKTQYDFVEQVIKNQQRKTIPRDILWKFINGIKGKTRFSLSE